MIAYPKEVTRMLKDITGSHARSLFLAMPLPSFWLRWNTQPLWASMSLIKPPYKHRAPAESLLDPRHAGSTRILCSWNIHGAICRWGHILLASLLLVCMLHCSIDLHRQNRNLKIKLLGILRWQQQNSKSSMGSSWAKTFVWHHRSQVYDTVPGPHSNPLDPDITLLSRNRGRILEMGRIRKQHVGS